VPAFFTLPGGINITAAMAATIVSLGCIRKAVGSISPNPISKSTIAVPFTSAPFTWPVQGHMADSFSIG